MIIHTSGYKKKPHRGFFFPFFFCFAVVIFAQKFTRWRKHLSCETPGVHLWSYQSNRFPIPGTSYLRWPAFTERFLALQPSNDSLVHVIFFLVVSLLCVLLCRFRTCEAVRNVCHWRHFNAPLLSHTRMAKLLFQCLYIASIPSFWRNVTGWTIQFKENKTCSGEYLYYAGRNETGRSAVPFWSRWYRKRSPVWTFTQEWQPAEWHNKRWQDGVHLTKANVSCRRIRKEKIK